MRRGKAASTVIFAIALAWVLVFSLLIHSTFPAEHRALWLVLTLMLPAIGIIALLAVFVQLARLAREKRLEPLALPPEVYDRAISVDPSEMNRRLMGAAAVCGLLALVLVAISGLLVRAAVDQHWTSGGGPFSTFDLIVMAAMAAAMFVLFALAAYGAARRSPEQRMEQIRRARALAQARVDAAASGTAPTPRRPRLR